MTGNDLMFAVPSKTTAAGLSSRAPVAAPQTNKPATILDMGEASREQGFRLNGCR